MSKKLETISLMRFLPPGAALVGEDGAAHAADGDGSWYAPCDRVDDLRGVLGGVLGDGPEPTPELRGYDEVLPLGDDKPAPCEDVIVLRFRAG